MDTMERLMLTESAIIALIAQCAPTVAPETLLAVIQTESKGNPYAIGINNDFALDRQPQSYSEAVRAARALLAQGANIDMGLGQINSSNMKWLKLSVEDAFTPCKNINAAGYVLATNYKAALEAGEPRPLGAAISAYNTGSMTKGYRNGYVAKVFGNAGTSNSQSAAPTPDFVGKLLIEAFGGRITDTWRPMNANYGADRSYHKIGQAVDFIPAGGMAAISKREIASMRSSKGIVILELLGPGDVDHDDHFHVAFANKFAAPSSVYLDAPSGQVSGSGDEAGEDVPMENPVPPTWDVFALAAWQKSQTDGVD